MKFIVQGLLAMVIMFTLALIVANTTTAETTDTSAQRIIVDGFGWN
ncbi:MAG: hypothetical protein H6817_10995 [Phycisphaerales bacterium]|nr:hypothetical protein [Phycisphaerales bacterium]